MRDRTAELGTSNYHSTADFESAVAALSTADLIRLKRVGMLYSGGTGMAPEELLSEAFLRAAGGNRIWPVGVDVVRFLAEAMRSIASGARASVTSELRGRPIAEKRATLADSITEAVIDRQGVVIDLIRPAPSPEQQLIEREEAVADAARFARWRQELLDAFQDDYPAQLLVEGMMDGLRGKPLQELAGLTDAEFRSKYKKVSRRIDALTASRRQT